MSSGCSKLAEIKYFRASKLSVLIYIKGREQGGERFSSHIQLARPQVQGTMEAGKRSLSVEPGKRREC